MDLCKSRTSLCEVDANEVFTLGWTWLGFPETVLQAASLTSRVSFLLPAPDNRQVITYRVAVNAVL
jgi:hypothetical protein